MNKMVSVSTCSSARLHIIARLTLSVAEQGMCLEHPGFLSAADDSTI